MRRRCDPAQLNRLARLEREPYPIALGVSSDNAKVLDAAYGPWWKEWLGPMAPEHREAGLALLLEQATWTEVERAEWAKEVHLASRRASESPRSVES